MRAESQERSVSNLTDADREAINRRAVEISRALGHDEEPYSDVAHLRALWEWVRNEGPQPLPGQTASSKP